MYRTQEEADAELQEQVEAGELDFKASVVYSNIHSDEIIGTGSVMEFLRLLAVNEPVDYRTLDVEEALDSMFFTLIPTENPDVRADTLRAGGNGFDLNRDNTYQTQPEIQEMTSVIAKWNLVSLRETHGYCTQC